jgi:Fe-S cluster assembly iron-binding protein IscA
MGPNQPLLPYKEEDSLTGKSDSIIKLDPGVSQALTLFLKENNINLPLRLDLHFTGCCDASLCLRPDEPGDEDLILEKEGLTFIIHPEVYTLTGEITIFYLEETCRKGFVIKSSKPLGEWEGFGLSEIKT